MEAWLKLISAWNSVASIVAGKNNVLVQLIKRMSMLS